MPDGNGADLQKFMKEVGLQTPSIIYTNSLYPKIPVVSDNFLGVIEKTQWEKLVSTIEQLLLK